MPSSFCRRSKSRTWFATSFESTSYAWTVAEQTADTGGEVMEGGLVWSVAQVSDAVGAGFLAAAAG